MILDYLDKSFIKPLDELTETRRDFPWFFIKDSIGYGKKSFPVFTHLIYEKDRKINSTPELFDYVLNILNTICNKHNIEYKFIDRIQINLLLNHLNCENYDNIHTDKDDKGYKSILIYLNDSEGDTIIYDKETYYVAPEQGKYVIFDSNLKHTASLPKDTLIRKVINIIIKMKDK
jgi:hypothetical protein